MVSRRVTLFPGWRLLGHLWSPKLIFDSKSEPTAPPKCSQGPTNGPKMIPKWPQVAPMMVPRCPKKATKNIKNTKTKKVGAQEAPPRK